MFDLNEEILKWRRSLAESDPLDEPAVDELESHLREEIESLVSLNLSEEESLWLARRRLGGAGDLSREFGKINRSAVLRARLVWMAAGVLAYILAIQSGIAVAKLGALLAALGGAKGAGLGIVAAVSELLVVGLILYLAYRVQRKVSTNPRLGWWSGNITGRIIFFIALAVSFIALAITATRMVGSVAAARIMGMQDYGMAAIGSAYIQLALDVLLPVVLVVMVIVLRKSRSHEVGA